MPTPTSPPDTTPELDLAACQRALAILVDVGTALAQECKIPSAETSLSARTLAYDRVALAVRRAIILHDHLATAIPARERQAATQAATRDAKRDQDRRHILRTVEDTIDRHAPRAEIAALRLELLDRIDTPEFAEDLATRPPEQLIGELCRDLALANLPGRRPHLRRTADDIAILCAQAAAPSGSGLPRWCAEALPQADKNDEARRQQPQPHDRS